MQTLVNILPIIFVALILIGAVGWIASAGKHKDDFLDRSRKKRDAWVRGKDWSTEYGTGGGERIQKAIDELPGDGGESQTIPVLDPEWLKQVIRGTMEIPEPERKTEPGKETEPKPILRAFDFKEA